MKMGIFTLYKIKTFRNELSKNDEFLDIDRDQSHVKPEHFNFDSFKKRNKEIKGDIQEENNQDFEPIDQLDDKVLLNQLKNFINNDPYPIDLKAGQINKNSEEIIQREDKLEDRFENVLVQRPPKGFVWGVGDQAKKKKRK